MRGALSPQARRVFVNRQFQQIFAPIFVQSAYCIYPEMVLQYLYKVEVTNTRSPRKNFKKIQKNA
jgi:hypothetical protein